MILVIGITYTLVVKSPDGIKIIENDIMEIEDLIAGDKLITIEK